MSALLEVKNLKKYFKVKDGKLLHAVDDVSFKIDPGKTLGVVGESGCGKSTLGRTILHLIEPTDGEIWFEGEDVTSPNRKQLRRLRENMQLIFQDPYSSLDARFSVCESIMEPLKIQRKLSKSEILEETRRLMDTVGLASRFENSYPHEMDGGRRQRVGIARALALNPKFIVCDEPVSALDVSIQAQIINLMLDLQEQKGLAYMFVTHDLSVVKYISDDILVMYMGTMVEKAPANELFQSPLHPYTQALLSAIPGPDLSARNKRIIMHGEISSPISPKPGCRFAPRCPYATEECARRQVLTEVSKDHFVSCSKVTGIVAPDDGNRAED
ncbi:MAG: ATP-binding cassette domain-containing protein [Oscillospiraceae bacterium]|nr:ATP-binding cassette domain-containing protein [Oscillospiraceae bacterium]